MDDMELTNDLTKLPIEAQYLKNGCWRSDHVAAFSADVKRTKLWREIEEHCFF